MRIRPSTMRTKEGKSSVARAVLLYDTGDEKGPGHLAWWDGESYWILCGATFADGSLFGETDVVTCKRCGKIRLSGIRRGVKRMKRLSELWG